MNLRRLECFVNLVESKSFTQTAQALHLTQPTITKYLSQLEDELNIQLLEKNQRKRQVVLTDIGQRVYLHAKKLLENEQDLLKDIASYKNTQVGTLKLGVPPLGAQLLTPTLFEFHRCYPKIQLSFLEVGSKAIKTALLQNELDVGVLLEEVAISEDFHTIPLCCFPLNLVLRRDAVWASRQSIHFSELKHQSFLLFQDHFSLNEVILSACEKNGFSPNIVCKSSQWNLLVDMVYQRMGVALLPQYYTDLLDTQKFCAVPVHSPSINWSLVMAWKKNILLSPSSVAWLTIIQKYFIYRK